MTRRREPLLDRFLARIQISTETGCWNWTAGKHTKGYGRIDVSGKWTGAHRVSYEIYRGSIPPGIHVLHHCDNPACVNPEHLFLGTNAENVKDKVSKGRQANGDKIARRGEDHAGSKLTETEVLAIRSSIGITQRELARRYGVCQQSISLIRSGKHWSHINEATSGVATATAS